MKGRKY